MGVYVCGTDIEFDGEIDGGALVGLGFRGKEKPVNRPKKARPEMGKGAEGNDGVAPSLPGQPVELIRFSPVVTDEDRLCFDRIMKSAEAGIISETIAKAMVEVAARHRITLSTLFTKEYRRGALRSPCFGCQSGEPPLCRELCSGLSIFVARVEIDQLVDCGGIQSKLDVDSRRPGSINF